jgi:hypothetical protein
MSEEQVESAGVQKLALAPVFTAANCDGTEHGTQWTHDPEGQIPSAVVIPNGILSQEKTPIWIIPMWVDAAPMTKLEAMS